MKQPEPEVRVHMPEPEVRVTTKFSPKPRQLQDAPNTSKSSAKCYFAVFNHLFFSNLKNRTFYM